jgi:DNA-binding MarR family transcriptional regulator
MFMVPGPEIRVYARNITRAFTAGNSLACHELVSPEAEWDIGTPEWHLHRRLMTSYDEFHLVRRMPRAQSAKCRRRWYEALAIPIEQTRGCLNLHLRRVSRQVSRHYDDALRPAGLRITQFTILAVLAQTGRISVTDLSNMLGMERSALARGLKPVARKRFVAVSQGHDKRTRLAEITRAGTRKLNDALPRWKQAQSELTRKLGPDQTALLIGVLASLRRALEGRS